MSKARAALQLSGVQNREITSVSNAIIDGAVDVSVALTNFLGGPNSFYKFAQTVNFSTNVGYYRVDGGVFVPHTVSRINGYGYGTRFYTGSTPNPIIFRLNTDGADWVSSHPTVNTTKFSDFYFNAEAAAANGVKVTAIQLGGGCHIHDAQFAGVQTAVSQVEEYLDLVRVERVSVYNQATTDGWAIDLGWTGDGVFLNQNHFQFTPGAGAARTRVRAVRLRYKVGTVVQNHLNGDHLFDQCDAIICQSMHMEDGLIEFRNSSGLLANSGFWMRGPDTGDCSITPVQLTYASGLSTVVPGMVRLSNLEFVYQQNFPGGYPTTLHNFSLQQSPSVFLGEVEVENLVRAIRPNKGAPGLGQLYGATCGQVDFDNNSHLASVQSRYVQGRWDVRGDLPGLPQSAAIIDVGTSSLSDARVFTGATGNYYYKITILYDKLRMLGLAGSAEKSFSVTANGNAPELIVDATSRYRAIYRIYRGAASGSYDRYVDVPLIAGARFIDTGADIGGYPWIARSTGGVDAINPSSILGYTLEPGEASAASDAYGHATVRTRGNQTPPTTGAWRRGDVILLETPVNDNRSLMVGYVRRTDCTLASPANVLNVDWFELWVPYRPGTASTTELSSVANVFNTTNKKVGTQVFCTNSSPPRPLWASGPNTNSPWVDATGATVVTPV
jgi:hypothetical protein